MTLPARLESNGQSLLVWDPLLGATGGLPSVQQNPALPTGSSPAQIPLDPSSLTEAQLAGLTDRDSGTNAVRELPRNATGGTGNAPRRPSLSSSRGTGTDELALEQLLPHSGSALSLHWVISEVSDEELALEDASLEPEVMILRLDEDSFRAILVLDEGLVEDPADEGRVLQDPVRREEERSESGGSEPKSPRERWTRWFAESLPSRPAGAVPETRAELKAQLRQVLGERKVRYLAAASRELDAQEAAQLLGQVRRWTLEQRPN